ncbi:protein kinase [Planotetraspora sp. A-T 1434]|uniref:serine/threonine-protein kinase n=1 Tax=Planotetraspora sp. A-T 1434 TaxID=2979219 RepID=UPI0021C14B4E|nr:serine/threonine-protein kinase [Planotetraspora sp. A-T 1434]MCT9929434.1 protein kinase [Planotetraspora sp. A-T 1434]
MPEGQRPPGSVPPGGTPEGQGRLVGRRYRLLSPVGRGGMGMVWHAHDVLLDRDVAVKELILPYGLDHAGTQVAHRRMLREARSAARLSHPGIVTVHDVVEEDGRPWIVMELVRAWSLEQAVRQSGPLPVVQAAEIGIRVLDALRHAHAAGILHRDVKPGNVLLTADRVVLTDFGIAAIEGDVNITQTGLLMGSPAYIPPERLQGRPITHAADLWSFGATLYAAVEGRPPYEGPDAVAVLGAVLTQEPNRPQRAGALLPVIEGLLRKNPADRIPAAQVADMLERVLHSNGTGLPGRGPAQASMPTPQDSTPVRLLPPFDLPSGPLPSRIIETPSGPVRVPYTPEQLSDPLGGHSRSGHPLDASGQHVTEPYVSGPHMSGPHVTGPHVTGPHVTGPQAAGLPGPRVNSSGVNVPGPHALPAFDPLTSHSGPSGSSHAPERSREAIWPTPSPSDLPGDLARGLPREPARDGSRDLATAGPTRSRSSAGAVAGSTETGGTRTGSTRPGGRRRREEVAPLEERGSRSVVLMAVAAVAVIGVVVTVLLVLLPSGPDDDQSTARQPVSLPRTQSPFQQPQTAVEVPKGFKSVSQGGVSLAVPKEWTAAAQGDAVTFSGPKDSAQTVRVQKIPDGSLSALQAAEQNLNIKDYPDYTQVQLGEASYRWPAADWEYTYTNSSKVTVHTVIRYLEAKGQAYAITFSSPDYDWNESAAPVRQALWSTFTPA